MTRLAMHITPRPALPGVPMPPPCAVARRVRARQQRGAATAWVLATLAGAAVATVVHAPAQWLVNPIANLSNGRVSLVNVHGTVWQGQGGLVFGGGPGSQDRTAVPGTVTWQLRPAWSRPTYTTHATTQAASSPTGLQTGNQTSHPTGSQAGQPTDGDTGPGLALALHAACCMQAPLTVWWSPGLTSHGLAVAAHLSTWPAGLLSGLGTPWNTLQLQAGLTLGTTGLNLQLRGNRWLGRGAATLDVQDASSRLSTVKPMGSYRLTWQWPPTAPGEAAAAADPTLTLQTLQGALQLSGSGQWVAGRLRFEGTAEAAAGREEALTNLMNLLGRRQGTRTLIKIG